MVIIVNLIYNYHQNIYKTEPESKMNSGSIDFVGKEYHATRFFFFRFCVRTVPAAFFIASITLV